MARHAAAKQSSSAPLGDATRAVDCGMSAIWWHGSCSCTMKEPNPWWRVDLSLVHEVWHVTVTQLKECKQDVFGTETHNRISYMLLCMQCILWIRLLNKCVSTRFIAYAYISIYLSATENASSVLQDCI